MTPRPSVVSLMGPTASGKTALAVDLAKQLNGEVISVDSALVYRGMDIGTAKPSELEQDGIKHWLLDIVDPDKSYSVAHFRQDALSCITDILARGKQPILAGGTMMYFFGLIKGLSSLPQSDQKVRTDIQDFISQYGLEAAHTKLKSVDPQSAERIHANDLQRVTRALEVFQLSGKTITELQAKKTAPLPYQFIQFGLLPNKRAELHERIEHRFDKMLNANFEQEVKKLRQDFALHSDMPSIRSVGYRQMWQYLEGELSFGEMREKGIIATRQLAKRQITWMRGWEDMICLKMGDDKNIDMIFQHIT